VQFVCLLFSSTRRQQRGRPFHNWNREIPANVSSEHRWRPVVGATERYTYPPYAGVVIHEDDWRAAPGITFREHEGRGYWHGDRWTDF
jgi:hypothetical protein